MENFDDLVQFTVLAQSEIPSETFPDSFMKIWLDLAEMLWIICLRMANKNEEINVYINFYPFQNLKCFLKAYSETPLHIVIKHGITIECSGRNKGEI